MNSRLSRTLILLGLFVAMGCYVAWGQVCQVDSQYTSAGIYPSDTLPDMYEGTAYTAVVQFVFPVDTTVFGFTLNFDSFVVAAVNGIPNGINWECNANHPVCHYICQPPNLTRGCVKIFGLPTAQSPAYPGYDSIIVTGQAWVTIPFTGATSFNQDIPVFYRIQGLQNIKNHTFSQFDLQVLPNPVTNMGLVTYHLPEAADVGLSVVDVHGRHVMEVEARPMAAGGHEETIKFSGLPSGMYFLRATVNDGAYETTQKFLKLD
jgi:hypothetical protein